jgi:hypothetical protein
LLLRFPRQNKFAISIEQLRWTDAPVRAAKKQQRFALKYFRAFYLAEKNSVIPSKVRGHHPAG